ncbi:MAG: hypothetical protein U9O78_04950 [Patescibacteria group bacterium]|nr:hypothetical protein [Patescibacteria group bacterium]
MPSLKASAIAPSNIAFSKYWGKSNEKLILPLNDNISMTLGGVNTHTTVDFSDKYKKNEVWIGATNQPMTLAKKSQFGRVANHLNFLKKKVGVKHSFKAVSKNNFPMDAGIASSASAFCALTLAAIKALGLKAGKSNKPWLIKTLICSERQ